MKKLKGVLERHLEENKEKKKKIKMRRDNPRGHGEDGKK